MFNLCVKWLYNYKGLFDYSKFRFEDYYLFVKLLRIFKFILLRS